MRSPGVPIRQLGTFEHLVPDPGKGEQVSLPDVQVSPRGAIMPRLWLKFFQALSQVLHAPAQAPQCINYGRASSDSQAKRKAEKSRHVPANPKRSKSRR